MKVEQFCIAIALLMVLIPVSPAFAATSDEIISMHEAGVPSEIIIEVIEVTGFDDPLDTETIYYLVDYGVDQGIIDYLLSRIDDDSDFFEEDSFRQAWGDDISNHPNWGGGDGFHHGTSGYNPLNERNRQGDYREGQRYRDNDYYRSNRDGGGIYIYAPPVYILDDGYWYGGYRTPRYYDNRNRNVRYSDPYYYDDYSRYYDRYWRDRDWCDYRYRYRDGWSGSYFWDGYYDGRRHYWGSSFDAYYRDDDFRIRISF